MDKNKFIEQIKGRCYGAMKQQGEDLFFSSFSELEQRWGKNVFDSKTLTKEYLERVPSGPSTMTLARLIQVVSEGKCDSIYLNIIKDAAEQWFLMATI